MSRLVAPGDRSEPAVAAAPSWSWRRFARHNGLTLVLLGFFLLTLGAGQFLTGRAEYNTARVERGLPPVGFAAYLGSPHFLEATAENWESEFFQMFVYVTLTVFLWQKGSAESSDPDNPRTPEPALTARSPWAARRGGWVRKLYEHSLSLVLAGLFMLSFMLHAVGGTGCATKKPQPTAKHCSLPGATSAPRAFGSSPSRTGRANFFPSG